jgi:hypothetical protein
MLEEGKYRSAGELAEAEGVTRSFVNRLLRLTLLAPDIQEAILDGRQPKGMQLEKLTRVMPMAWEEKQLLAKPESGDTNLPGWWQGKRISENVGRRVCGFALSLAGRRNDAQPRFPLQSLDPM